MLKKSAPKPTPAEPTAAQLGSLPIGAQISIYISAALSCAYVQGYLTAKLDRQPTEVEMARHLDRHRDRVVEQTRIFAKDLYSDIVKAVVDQFALCGYITIRHVDIGEDHSQAQGPLQ